MLRNSIYGAKKVLHDANVLRKSTLEELPVLSAQYIKEGYREISFVETALSLLQGETSDVSYVTSVGLQAVAAHWKKFRESSTDDSVGCTAYKKVLEILEHLVVGALKEVADEEDVDDEEDLYRD